MLHKSSKVTGGVLLVAGTAIGAGMLALPVSTGLSGFFPAEIAFVFAWLFLTYTAFLILEVNLWMDNHANMITMAKRTLGNTGRVAAWISYLFLLYALTTAYIAVSGELFQEFVQAIWGIELPGWLQPLPLLAIFSYFVYAGAHSVDHFNRWLMGSMVVAFVVLMAVLTPEIDAHLLARADWKYTLVGVSVVMTSFGYHIIIPTLTKYLDRDVTKLKRVLLIGSILPLGIYTLWQAVALGIIPLEGPHGLWQGFASGANGAALITHIVGSSWIHVLARCFAFLAIMTSFLGVSLSLWDCLADGLHLTQDSRGKAILYSLTFIPPLGFALATPRAFLTALEFAGAYGVVTLLALLPALMVWAGRYHLSLGAEMEGRYRVPGGKPALVAVILVSLVIIVVETLNKTGVLHQMLL